MKNYLIILFLIGLFCAEVTEAKKIKSTLKVEKESKINKNKTDRIPGVEILLADAENLNGSETDSLNFALRNISFSGYEKEANSSKETFLLTNPTDTPITGFQVRIDYLDMKDRMLHSRVVTEPCFVPDGESRKLDIKSWDNQHTYYYYLGNEPKKVATPFKVTFTPISYWVELK